MTFNLEIYLSRWTIEVGNYDDFSVGERRKFALEFWASTPLIDQGPEVMLYCSKLGTEPSHKLSLPLFCSR
jgi:hypothetical protein